MIINNNKSLVGWLRNAAVFLATAPPTALLITGALGLQAWTGILLCVLAVSVYSSRHFYLPSSLSWDEARPGELRVRFGESAEWQRANIRALTLWPWALIVLADDQTPRPGPRRQWILFVTPGKNEADWRACRRWANQSRPATFVGHA